MRVLKVFIQDSDCGIGSVAEVRPGLRVLKVLPSTYLVLINNGCRGSTRFEGTESTFTTMTTLFFRPVAEVRPGLRVLKELLATGRSHRAACCRGSTRFEGTERIIEPNIQIQAVGCRGSTRFEGTESFADLCGVWHTGRLQRFDPV